MHRCAELIFYCCSTLWQHGKTISCVHGNSISRHSVEVRELHACSPALKENPLCFELRGASDVIHGPCRAVLQTMMKNITRTASDRPRRVFTGETNGLPRTTLHNRLFAVQTIHRQGAWMQLHAARFLR